jgi:hypothetical protein
MVAQPPSLEPLIAVLRGHRVIFDADLACLYGVPTKALNQAAKRNRARFPNDFAFQLVPQEAANATAGGATNRSRSVTGSQRHRDPRHLPWAFTEHGALMAANVLRSDRAVQMSVHLVRAFVRMRERLAADTAILKRLAEVDRALLVHGGALREMWKKLQPLLAPPPDPPRRRIGFHEKS